MEVHHHTHTERKKWYHYFWEFFMLFLAVSAGFFVENLREHNVDNKKEKEFIRSLAHDLKTDITQLDSIIIRRKAKQQMADSMLLILYSPDPDRYGNQLYYFARLMPRILVFRSNDGTLQQLKNAGYLRLIKHTDVVNRIMMYDEKIRNWKFWEDREESLIQQYYPALKTMFDARVFETMVNGMNIKRPVSNPHLLVKDKQHVDELCSDIHFLKNANDYHMQLCLQQRSLAKETLDYLQKEYHLK
jgi:hypothetical protein